MELRQLKTFVAVAELRHFAKAAGRRNLSQPAVSHQIALLEEELGARLLNRAARNVSLTVAGEVFLGEARRILAAVDRAHERMDEVARGAVGRIRLGATPTAGLYWLPSRLVIYRQAHRDYELRFEIAAAPLLAARVARNDLDMAIIDGPIPGGELRGTPLAGDTFLIVAAPGSPLLREDEVKSSRLEGEPWLLREDGSDTRRQTLAWWHRQRIAPSRTMTFDGPDAVKRSVMAGLGIAMVSKLTVKDELAAGMLAAIAIKAALPERSILLADHPQKHHGVACRAMMQLLSPKPRESGIR